VTVIGSVSVKMQIGKFTKIAIRKIAFCFRGEIDKTKLHKPDAKSSRTSDCERMVLPVANRRLTWSSLAILFPLLPRKPNQISSPHCP
jgi:hypothetical protein